MRIFRHKHKWIAKTPFTITKKGKEFVRVFCFCKKCGVVCHKHLPTLNEVEK